MQRIKLGASFINNSRIKVFFFILIIFPLLASVQVRANPVEDVVLHVNNQLSHYSRFRQPKVGNILHHVNGELIKTNVNQTNELVFILAGQSNMAGHGTTAKLSANYRRTPANVKFYFNGYPAQMNRFARFGPEVGFAHAISRRFPHKTIKLIKFAVGGTSLFAWDPNWRLGKARQTRNASAGPLFKKLIKTVRRHTSVKGVKFAGILWMQGETDARYSNAARTYAQNLSRFVRALRKELKSPTLAFFMGEVDPPANAFPFRDMVRKAQRSSTASIRNSRLISTRGLAKRHDHLHYSAAGQLALGGRFAKAFIQTVRR
ncbi:MAG: sialate O-acetylesterase [Cocleimonas sp.]|nr:sialate O-acetylesterase [Cocleimonas sp.]